MLFLSGTKRKIESIPPAELGRKENSFCNISVRCFELCSFPRISFSFSSFSISEGLSIFTIELQCIIVLLDTILNSRAMYLIIQHDKQARNRSTYIVQETNFLADSVLNAIHYLFIYDISDK